jgi:hypothetical protein
MFELVFDNDWEFTLHGISGIEGTFLNPRERGQPMTEEDESNNWANRGALLSSFRQLKQALVEECPHCGQAIT